MEVDKETVLPTVRLGHSEQSHSAFLTWEYENFKYGFSVNPSEEYVGTGWMRMECAEANMTTGYYSCSSH
jgi:hypothetical protein